MQNYWIIASKYARDEDTKGWDDKWTINSFIKNKKYYPTQKNGAFTPSIGDKCLLRAFKTKQLVAKVEIKSEIKVDHAKDNYYEIDVHDVFDFPLSIDTLPNKYKKIFIRSREKKIKDVKTFYELIGIINYVQNLKISYKDILQLKFREKNIEDFLDSISNPLKKQKKLEIVDRQITIHEGNKIDLICKDEKGDLVVVEMKKQAANETIGQLARYITDVRENYAKPTQNVRGLILSYDIDEQLIKAARGVDFEVTLYQIAYI